MTTALVTEKPIASESQLPSDVVGMLSIGCGVTVANLWYAQPLLAQMAMEWHVSQATMGTVACCPLAGYATGMLLFVPLGDIVERRRLMLLFLGGAVITLFGLALAPSVPLLALFAFVLGVATIVPQLIIPYAVGLTGVARRGVTVGKLMTGLLTGILLSRTVGGLIAEHLGWRAVYWFALAANLVLMIWFAMRLPESRPATQLSYGQLVRSILHLVTHERVLITSSFFGAMTFACFNIFWTTLSFFLAGPPYNYTPQTIGSFGLMGVAGALAAPYVGKLADSRGPMFAIGISLFGMLMSYVILGTFSLSIIGTIIGVFLLDLFVQSSQVSNMARVYSLPADKHSRLATIYMVSYFLGGTGGAWLGTQAWSANGWMGVCGAGSACAVAGIILFLFVSLSKKDGDS